MTCWHGPSWLRKKESAWPVSLLEFNSEPLETRKRVKLLHVTENTSVLNVSNFSTFTRLQRVTAMCLRFIKNCKSSKSKRTTGDLKADELAWSTTILIKIDQSQSFPQEFKELRQGHNVSNKSSLFELNPFLDSNDIIRVGGWIQLSENSNDKKFPMVLAKTHLSKLVLKNEHENLGHAGCNLSLASIREKIFPISGKNQLKQIIHACVKCYKIKPNTINPMMGILPNVRVNQATAFYRSGVNYAGPILIKNKSGRGCRLIKSCICLFIYMCIKAIHLELTSELSSNSFLAAFRRFIARRGKPNEMFSDNGTFFVAANRELNELAEFLEQTQSNFEEVLATEGISWSFIPAYAPHFGGLWEAGVKQTKNHLKKLVGNVNLTYEELNTTLCQIEAILNSRPLTPISSDPNDLSALTHGHFLIGRGITSAPDKNYTDTLDNRLNKFQLVQKVQQQFWARWHREYISELQVRNKWNSTQHPLQEGTLVLVKGENSPPLRWPLGRILQVFPGPDGVSRVALVKTTTGVFKRAFSKLCPLPIEGKSNC